MHPILYGVLSISAISSSLSRHADQPTGTHCCRRDHESGFLRVEDAYGAAAKCPGMKLGLELRMVAGKRVGGVPQSMVKQIVQASPSPVEMVFIEPDGRVQSVRVTACVTFRL